MAEGSAALLEGPYGRFFPPKTRPGLPELWIASGIGVTPFLGRARHPTPRSVVEPWCGREATDGMRTKGLGRDHSPAAWALKEDYRIGVYRSDPP